MSENKLTYTLGLDVGIGSVGWAVIEDSYDPQIQNFKPRRLINSGVRLFDVAEVPKTGDSPAKARRVARSVRRRLHRRSVRLAKVKRLLLHSGFIASLQDLSQKWHDDGPFTIRLKALDEKVSDIELARAILHIIKRRGFKSSRKNIDLEIGSNKELTEYKDNLLANHELVVSGKYRSVAHMLSTDPRFEGKKRNRTTEKDGKILSVYTATIMRDDLEKELRLILDTQAKFGNTKVTSEFIHKTLEIFTTQKHFSEGMNITKMIGACTFEPDEPRAPKFSYSFEKFRLYQDLQNLVLIDTQDKNRKRRLEVEQKQNVINHAWETKTMDYKKLRKLLGLSESVLFEKFRYQYGRVDNKSGKSVDPEKKTFFNPKGYFTLKDACKDSVHNWDSLKSDPILMDTLLTALSIYKTDEQLEKFLKEKGIASEYIHIAQNAPTLDNFGHLSLKAIRKITPFLLNNTYDKACELAGYHFRGRKGEKTALLPQLPDSIKNPVVLRALTQSRKMVNAIIRRYGSPTFIHIELAREMSKTRQERNEMNKAMQERENQTLKVIEDMLSEMGIGDPSGKDILKYKLWKQQNGYCAYSLKQITPEMFIDPNRAQIDHILPYSRSLDDSYFNKALVLVEENQQKRDQTPLEYLRSMYGQDSREEHIFREALESWPSLPKRTKEKLLEENFAETSLDEYIERDLNDTRYIARELKNHIEDYLQMADIPAESKNIRRVYTYPGFFTAFMRRSLGIKKDRGENHRHHAMDAIILAISNPSLLQTISAFYKRKELHLMKEGDKRVVEPWSHFRTDVFARVYDDDLSKLDEEDDLKSLYADIRTHLTPLFVARAPNMKTTGQAHEQTMRSPKGEPQGMVKLNQGRAVADNGGMVRVDVFKKDKKYYYVPIYVHDFAKKQLPNKATTGQDVSKWIEMTSEYHFLFSLHPNEYVRIVDGKQIVEGYYVKFYRNNGNICLTPHDKRLVDERGKQIFINKTAKNVDYIKKYSVDLFGNLHEIKEEKRRGIS